MRSTTRLLVSASALLLSACGGASATFADRAEATAEALRMDAVDEVWFSETSVTMRGLRLGTPVSGSRTGSQLEEDEIPAFALVTRTASLEALDLEALETAWRAIDDCSSRPLAIAVVAHGGGVLHNLMCAPTSDQGGLSVAIAQQLEGRPVVDVEGWDATSVERVLAEARHIAGEQVQRLSFTTPALGALNTGWDLLVTSDRVLAPGGSACTVLARRKGTGEGQSWNSVHCSALQADPGDEAFPISAVSAQALFDTLTAALDREGATLEGLRRFDVKVESGVFGLAWSATGNGGLRDGFEPLPPAGN